MGEKFSFYDFVGYVIPGGFALLLLYWLCVGFLGLTWPLELSSFGESLAILGGSYLLGHLVQAIGRDIERRQVKEWGGWFSEQFMRDNNAFFTPEFKAVVKKCAVKRFGLPREPSGDISEVENARRQEVFRLCYSLLIQEGWAKHAEVFNGMYGLYRGLLTATKAGVVVALAIAVKQVVVVILSASGATVPAIGLPGDRFWLYQDIQLFLSAISIPFFLFAIRQFEAGLKRFGEYFASAVYRDFYILCTRDRSKEEAGSPSPSHVEFAGKSAERE